MKSSEITTFGWLQNVRQNRSTPAPVSAPGIPIPRSHFPSLNILTINALVEILVIFSPKPSVYDTSKKAHERAYSAQGLPSGD